MRKLAIEYLLETSDRLPDKTAVVDRGQSISFGELRWRALELACALSDSGLPADLPVVLDFEKSIEAVTALLAVQASGRIYVPLDPDTPRERRARMLAVLGPHLVLDHDQDGYRVDGHPVRTPPRPIDAMKHVVRQALRSRTSLDPLYVIFTSGSTGTPKGVTIANGSVIDYIEWARATYDVSEREVIGSQAPFHFDNSVLDLYLMLACGCTLHLIPKDHFVFLPELVSYLREHGISLVFFVPSLLSNVASLDLLDGDPLPALRKVLFAGEAMPPGTLRYLRERLPHALLSNLYGPTEITVDCIYRIFGDDVDGDRPVPLGLPCDNHEILFLDEARQPLQKAGAVGEICVAGAGVALGYWNDPEATRRAFIQDPRQQSYRKITYCTGDLGYRSAEDGLIYMTGRRDDQIKHLGHRIELGEIQSALDRLPGIVQSAVLYDEARKAILAFYVARSGERIGGLRERLAAELPPYMMPREIVRVDGMPFTSSGKVDRDALRDLRARGSQRTP